tara:strand:+ start:216 stop:464 length:249 start_codon:yes stop_codon:yes gene_type:complete
MPYSEDKPITTKDVIDQIAAKNLDGARDGIQDVLYKKSAEAMADKKVEVANGIGKGFDPTADVIDAPTTVEPIDFEPTTSEE